MKKVPKVVLFHREKYQKMFSEAKINQNQINEILPLLEKIVNSGISQRDLDIVAHEIATKTTLRNQFLIDPYAAVEACCAFKVERR